MKKKQYKSKNLYKGKYFIDYLPEEVYYQLSEEDRVNYREYRRYSRFISESEERTEKYKREIEKLEKKISDERLKIGGPDTTHDWKLKMKDRFDSLGHLNKNFLFSCSVTKRRRDSKTLKLKSGDKIKKDTEIGVLKNKYKGKELEPVYLWYSQIRNSGNTIFKTLYLGKEEKLREFLTKIDSDGYDWSKDDIEDVRSELKSVISQYVRYQVFYNTWKTFEKDGPKHNLQTIYEWWEKVGDKRYNWGGTK